MTGTALPVSGNTYGTGRERGWVPHVDGVVTRVGNVAGSHTSMALLRGSGTWLGYTLRWPCHAGRERGWVPHFDGLVTRVGNVAGSHTSMALSRGSGTWLGPTRRWPCHAGRDSHSTNDIHRPFCMEVSAIQHCHEKCGWVRKKVGLRDPPEAHPLGFRGVALYCSIIGEAPFS